MHSYFISILTACVSPVITYGEGDKWDYNYQWTCEEPSSPYDLQIKAYQRLPETKTETVDLFNRFAASEVTVEQ